MKLVRLLQLGYSAERAAAFAYHGHAGSVDCPEEIKEITKIESEELLHRENILRMMAALEVRPSKYYEVKYYIVGKVISASCYVIGYFMPMYFAGKLESGNVNEYLRMMELARGSKIEHELECMLEMAKVEKEHEMYFLSRIRGHWMLPWFQKVFRWGAGESYNNLPYENVAVVLDQ